MFDGAVITPYVQCNHDALFAVDRPRLRHQREQQLLQATTAPRRGALVPRLTGVALPTAALHLIRGTRLAVSG